MGSIARREDLLRRLRVRVYTKLRRTCGKMQGLQHASADSHEQEGVEWRRKRPAVPGGLDSSVGGIHPAGIWKLGTSRVDDIHTIAASRNTMLPRQVRLLVLPGCCSMYLMC